MVDDLGYGDVGVFYQNLRQRQQDPAKPFQFTPALDRMAQEGAIFTNQYCNAPVCAPSRASFLTGMNQGNAHIRDNQFDKALEDNHTAANVLKAAGYTTAAIGKWGLQGEREEGGGWPAHPLKRGFDYYYGYMRHADGHEHYPFEGIYRGKKEVWENYREVSSGLEKCYTTDLWTAAAKRWIQKYKHGNQSTQPFFMFLAYDAPHAVLELPTQAYPDGGGLNGGMQWLGKKGQMINTAGGTPDSFIYSVYAQANYDDDLNPATPNVAWPDISDWLATFADAAGLSTPARTDSRSLLPTLKGGNVKEGSHIYVEYAVGGNTPDFGAFEPSRRNKKRGQMQMLRIGDKVGVRYDIQSAEDDFEIYDVLKDPKQTKNLAKQQKMEPLQQQMKALSLQSHRVDTAANRPYDKAFIPPVFVDGKLKAGLKVTVYKDTSLYLGRPDSAKVLRIGLSHSVGADTIKADELLVYDGYMHAPVDGYYDFSLRTNGKAIMRIHEILFLDADFEYIANENIAYGASMKAGYHPIKIYLKRSEIANLQVAVRWKKKVGDWEDCLLWYETGNRRYANGI